MGKHGKGKTTNPIWERKKNAIMMSYRKMLKTKNKFPQANRNFNENEKSQSSQNTFFQRAMTEFERRKAEKDRIKEIKDAKRKEKEEALARYAEKKREHFKKLSQKTKWGQPVMAGRMEILLEKIQKSHASDRIKLHYYFSPDEGRDLLLKRSYRDKKKKKK